LSRLLLAVVRAEKNPGGGLDEREDQTIPS
jgi:hypothetical protein